MRKAFSMITAIFIMILMATVAVFILNLSAKTVKTTVYQYKYEQAILLAKSYTELAIMYASANESNVTNCAENINGSFGPDPVNGNGYNITVNIAYIGSLSGPSALKCTLPNILNGSSYNNNDIITPNELQIIIDTFVKYKDTDMIGTLGVANTPWTTYHRRTLQKL